MDGEKTLVKEVDASERLKNISMPGFSNDELIFLYEHLLKNSDLSSDSILHEIENVAQNVDLYDDMYPALQIEDISFLISHNRYQEKDSDVTVEGGYANIQVVGDFERKQLFLISKNHNLIKATETKIQEIIKYGTNAVFRLSAFEIINKKKMDTRRLYILDEEPVRNKDAACIEKMCAHIRGSLGAESMEITESDMRSFVESASEKFLTALMESPDRINLKLYISQWLVFKDMARHGNDVYIADIDFPGKIDMSESFIHLWLTREKFQENYETINTIFERRGISFVRQFFETFLIDGRYYIAFTTFMKDQSINEDEAEFLHNEIFNRLILLKSTPVSVGTIKNMLNTIKDAKEYQKLGLIDHMQKNKQREYLVPLVLLLNENNMEIRYKAFGLIKHYLLNPTVEMKNDYYWSTLKNIFSAATVPIEREKDRPSRPLTDDEIIKLIKYRDIYYSDYVEPVTQNTYLFIRINGDGIGKGGIRAHERHVSFSGEGALATNMLFKTLGIGIPKYTIGKGGILGDIRFDSCIADVKTRARQNVLQAYADFLYYKAQVGPLSDVPAGDVGVGGEEIGIIFDRITQNAYCDIVSISKGSIGCDSPQAKILRENFGIPVTDNAKIRELASDIKKVEWFTAPAITGKPGDKGLSLRSGATGKGLFEVLAAQQNYHEFNNGLLWSQAENVGEAIRLDDDFYQKANKKIRMLTFAIQGFGKVGASLGDIVYKIGSKVKIISDVSGTLVNDRGIPDIDRIYDICKSGNSRLSDLPPELRDGSEFFLNDTIRPLGALANVIVPSALEDVITTVEREDGTHLYVRAFEGDYMLQGANGPATSEAEDVLAENGKISFPDILANSGGVLASYFEWLNGLIRQFGYCMIYENDFVHPVVHNLIMHFHPDAILENTMHIDEKVYEYAFKFILRHATVTTITLSRGYKISLRTAYLALGIRNASDECRLSDQFIITINKMRDSFAENLITDEIPAH